MSVPAPADSEHKTPVRYSIGPALVFSGLYFVFSPIALYNGNESEFHTSLLSILKVSVVPAAAVTAVLILVAALLRGGARTVYTAVLGGLAIAAWIQWSQSVSDYGILDGTEIDWELFGLESYLDVIPWVVLVAVALGRSRRFAGIASVLCGALFAAQVIGNAPYVLGDPGVDSIREIPDLSLEYSSETNTLHVLLDAVQSDIFAEVLAEWPALGERLDGFHWFRNTVGSATSTMTALPVIFADRNYLLESPTIDFMHDVVGQHGFFNALVDRGYQVHLKPLSQRCVGKYTTCYYIPKLYGAPELVAVSEAALLADLSMFRGVPHIVKPFVYNSQAWLLSQYVGAAGDDLNSQRGEFFSHLRFLRDYGSRVRVTDVGPTYHFIHLLGAHPPVAADSECNSIGLRWSATRQKFRGLTTCVFKRVLEFFDRLREIGVYDNTTIVLHSDHGVSQVAPLEGLPDDIGAHPVGTRNLQRIAGRSMVLLMVKKAHARGPLAVSDVPARLGDIPATVLKSVGVATEKPSVFDLTPQSKRTRAFYHREQVNSASLQQYIVEGHVSRYDSWKLGRVVFNKEKTSSRIDRDSEVARYSLVRGWSWKFRKRGTWALGPTAALVLRIPKGKARVVARMKPWSARPGAQIELKVDGRTAVVWDSPPGGDWHDYSVDLPADPLRPEVSVLELGFSDYRQPELRRLDQRFRAASFEWIEAIPIDEQANENEARRLDPIGRG